MQNTQFLDVSLELEVSVQVCWGEETVPAPKMIDKPYNQYERNVELYHWSYVVFEGSVLSARERKGKRREHT